MIEFILNNKIIKTDANESITLVDFIRDDKGLKGTKIVCREGDCAACSVLVGELDVSHNSVKYHTITSCISPLANAHGKHIVTIEGLNQNHILTPVQNSIKNNNATQCGFCTPGFVIAMTNYCLNPSLNSEEQMLDCIGGNICRCTGYVSLVKAAKDIISQTQNKGEKYQLQELISEGFIPEYFAGMALKLATIEPKIPNNHSSNIIAGGTDLYVQKADELLLRNHARFIHSESKSSVKIQNGKCILSANATVSDLFHNPELIRSIPELHDFLRLVSSEPIRNMAAIAGNFVNASPIADMSIFCLALDAELTLQSSKNSRKIRLKDFFLDYKKTALQKDEHISQIVFNIPNKSAYFNFEKISKRRNLDIATVNSAIYLEIKNDTVLKANIAIGGVAPIPMYLTKCSEFLINKEINLGTLKQLLEILNQEISPISDVRGTADYKKLLANQIIKQHFLKLFPDSIKFEEVL
ncbi:MAG TPA: FAD binding domain-containing protein [Gammaproteobacteria bacterium]|nr:FAD binding domain-containing protein [Xanthomonadales bacterium]MCB1593433.1 FAD binding domain-containing protein [Xanthomonadales bacterium]HOP21831.1 FAD binding domain-containing protein [Gammaproteobacteria bacterium]HPI96001.1 FAD binding domain-containing protein [Gammaproteobacteria bacterium]HPQ87512.1 FAD binding domain-containing protein [Gammaproteobacteria bacterium]